MPKVAEEAEDQMVTIRLGFAWVFGHMLYFSGFVAFAKGAATGHCICSAPNGIFRSAFFRKQPIAREASIHVMSVMSVLLSDYEFFEIYLILCFEYSPFIWRILLGNLYFSPPPFLSCHSPWMVVQRGGWWDGFDPHARVRDVLR